VVAVDRYSVGGSPPRERNRRAKFKNQLNVGYVNGYTVGVAVVTLSFDVRATSVKISLRLVFDYVRFYFIFLDVLTAPAFTKILSRDSKSLGNEISSHHIEYSLSRNDIQTEDFLLNLFVCFEKKMYCESILRYTEKKN